jgi:hypothetical protein
MKAGGCLCGKVRYVLKSEPGSLLDCHCIDCRRSSGAPYITWGTVATQDFQLTQGALKEIHFADRLRKFAPCCGTQIIFQDSETAETVDVTLASLDEPTAFQPAKALWCEDRLPWVQLNSAVPQFVKSSHNAK